MSSGQKIGDMQCPGGQAKALIEGFPYMAALGPRCGNEIIMGQQSLAWQNNTSRCDGTVWVARSDWQQVAAALMTDAS